MSEVVFLGFFLVQIHDRMLKDLCGSEVLKNLENPFHVFMARGFMFSGHPILANTMPQEQPEENFFKLNNNKTEFKKNPKYNNSGRCWMILRDHQNMTHPDRECQPDFRAIHPSGIARVS